MKHGFTPRNENFMYCVAWSRPDVVSLLVSRSPHRSETVELTAPRIVAIEHVEQTLYP
jgi:hypothetical protein